MNTDVITWNEYKNDGSFLHLYFNKLVDAWVAYGLSAYGLRLFVKTNGCGNLRGFSKELQLPCTLVDEKTITQLLQQAAVLQQITDSYLQFRMQDAVDMSAYMKWTNKLKGQHSRCNDDLSVETPISKYVPKDRFIPDGMSSFSRQVKRIGDCFLAFMALVLFSPLFLICYIAVRREDGGPAIFK